ncbi:MAG TPA: hypothetical protein VGH24_00800 [Solirubrobacteraceae bacterium]
MTRVTHQTISLTRGKHHSPRDGACVMELASMLAGEQFSDHPVSVCPVIGSLLRAHNDAIDDRRRQDLYRYAAEVVGSRSSGSVQEARAVRLTEWSARVRERERARCRRPFGLRALSRMLKVMFVDTQAHAYYRLTVHDDETHAEVLALVDELLAMKPTRAAVTSAIIAPSTAPTSTSTG